MILILHYWFPATASAGSTAAYVAGSAAAFVAYVGSAAAAVALLLY